jgi:N-acetylneuraminic acid mutarotase
MFSCICVIPLAVQLGFAHFVFVTPEPGGAAVMVIMSENLVPDLDAKMIAGTKLFVRDAGGQPVQLDARQLEKTFLTAKLPASGASRVVYGTTEFGVMQRGEGKPHLLVYHPKLIVGDAFDKRTMVGEAPVEIVPVGKPGAVALRVVAHGKPLADSEVTVILPDGSEKKMKTNAQGETPALAEAGRYGAWARFWEQTPGERDGKKFDEVRHYATLVAEVPAPTQAFATLPEATSSFGAVADDGWLYVYGGHVVATHNYSRESVSGKFHRMKLDAPGAWETLPGGRPLQGMNLAAHAGKIYLVGGMEPRNEKGQPADNHSIPEVARFDPANGRWEQMPPLPEPRSSHDVAVVGDQLIVVGGWALEGPKQHWRDTVLILDLSAAKPSWRSVPQPFQRRALMTAVLDGKVYVIGGMNSQQKVVRDVSIFDPKTNQWSEGPALPEGTNAGFAPAVGVHRGQLYVSIADGTLLRLNLAKAEWVKAGEAAPRVAHRLASCGDKLLVIGGAAKGKNFDLVEAVAVE